MPAATRKHKKITIIESPIDDTYAVNYTLMRYILNNESVMNVTLTIVI